LAQKIKSFDPVSCYFADVGEYGLITRVQEKALARRFKYQNDEDAADRLVTAHLRLVIKIAQKYRWAFWKDGNEQNFLDLIQEGNVGLVKAVRKFDPEKDVRLSSYASFWIRAYMLKFIRDNWSLVKIGNTHDRQKFFFNLRREKHNLMKEGIEPTVSRISGRMGVSVERIETMYQRLEHADASLNAPIRKGAKIEWVEILTSEEEPVEEKVAKRQIECLLQRKIVKFRQTLDTRDAEIFDERIWSEHPVTMKEIGNRYKISRQRVNQVEKRVLERLKCFLKAEIKELETLYDAYTDSGCSNSWDYLC